jgi:hypothetical protein
MFVWSQVDALRADFPETAARLGDDEFFELARRYLLAQPSGDPDIGQLGRGFAEFAHDAHAALEWARAEVFLEAEVPRMTPEEFAQRLAVRIVPSLRLAGDVAVWRAPGGFDRHEIRLPEDERRALQLALDGAPFDAICASFGDALRAYETLQSWLAEGWIAR